MRFEYRATFEDGSTLDIVADQRDIAEFESSENGVPYNLMTVKPFTFARWTAWHAGKRQKLHKLTWEQWKDQCVQVDSIEDETEEDETQDPGNPAASAGT